jgi:hypothetical protein
MLEAATRRVHNTFGNRLNYSGNNLPSYKTRFRWTSSMLSTEWVHEKTKDRLMRLCLQVFTCRKKKKSEAYFSRKEDNIKLVEIDVEITKIDSFLKTIRNTTISLPK